MTAKERFAFIMYFWPGLLLLIVSYVVLTIIRDYRSNFASNIWSELGMGNDTSVFTRSELPAAVVTLVLMSILVLVRNNLKAVLINHFIILTGFLLSIFSTVLYAKGYLSPFWWISWSGVGLYMSYVPFNCMLFDRLIASFKYVSNAGFIIYLSDSFGYLGSDAVLVAKNFMKEMISWSDFFIKLSLYGSAVGIVLVFLSAWYFRSKYFGSVSSTTKLKYV